MTPAVELNNITKSYGGVKALNGVDFDIRAGEVHALLGENGAGKSTLMRILGGDIQNDGGSISILGKQVQINEPADAKAYGIQIIHQELALAPDLSVAENIYLSELPTIMSWKSLNRSAKEVTNRIGYDINPRALTGNLSIAYQQIVEVAKALSKEAKIIVFDEPTAVLSGQDAERLHEIIRQLRDDGVGVVYISHRLDEVFQVSDRMTILKDGQTVGTVTPKEADVNDVIRMMVGRPMETLFPEKKHREIGDEILRVEGLSRGQFVKNVSFSLKRGEILGLGGLVGSGRTEVARLIFGADAIESGKVIYKGQEIKLRSPCDAVQAGIGLVPEDRKNEGVILDKAISVNVTMAKMAEIINRFGFIKHRKEKREVQEMTDSLRLKSASINAAASTLSGGNQQKVVLAKWMFADGEVIIFDEPTRGVDVGAKSEIYSIIFRMVESGKAVLVISSEHQELFGLCDRIIVMGHGELKGELSPDEYSEEKLLHIAMSAGATEIERNTDD